MGEAPAGSLRVTGPDVCADGRYYQESLGPLSRNTTFSLPLRVVVQDNVVESQKVPLHAQHRGAKDEDRVHMVASPLPDGADRAEQTNPFQENHHGELLEASSQPSAEPRLRGVAPTIQSDKVRRQEQQRQFKVSSARFSIIDSDLDSNESPDRSGDHRVLTMDDVTPKRVSEILSSFDEEVACHPELDQRFLYEKAKNTSLSEPSLAYLRHGQDWAKDVFCIYHNAIRREMVDLFYIVGSLDKRKYFLEKKEIRFFTDWFEGFENFTLQCLIMDEEHVMAWVERIAGPLEEEIAAVARKKSRIAILSRMASISAIVERAQVQTLPPGELLSNIFDAVNNFSVLLLRHFATQVRLVSPVIKSNSCAENVYDFSLTLPVWIRGRRNSHTLIHMLTRWTGENTRPLKRALEQAFVEGKRKTGGKILTAIHQRQWERSKDAFENGRVYQVKQFYQRWKRFAAECKVREAEELKIVASFLGHQSSVSIEL